MVAAPQHIGRGGGGFHLHHVVIGVVLVLVSGVTMVTLAVDGGIPEFTAAAIFFGIGAALVLDEFALILHLQDVYWSEDGRTSVDAVFVAVAIAGLLIMGFNPLSFFDINIWRDDASWQARAVVIAVGGADPVAGHGRAAQGQGVDGSGRHGFPPLLVSARCGCPARTRRGRGGATHPAEEDAPCAGA